jgi:hypothetical protein
VATGLGLQRVGRAQQVVDRADAALRRHPGAVAAAGEQADAIALAQGEVGHHQRRIEHVVEVAELAVAREQARPVSSISTSCWFFSSWYSREIRRRARAVAFQSIWRRLSPTRYSRIWWKSVPSPRRRFTCAPTRREACSALNIAKRASGAKFGNTRTRCGRHGYA